MDRGPQGAPADEDPGLLPMLCRASGNVLTSVGEYLTGAHPVVPLAAAEKNNDVGNADGQEPDEAAAAIGRQIASSENEQHSNTDDGDRHHEQIPGEAEGRNTNQAAAVTDDQDETGAARRSDARVDANSPGNDQPAAETLRVDRDEGEGGEERRRVVVIIESDDSDSEASQAAEEVIGHDEGETLAAVGVEGSAADGGIAGAADDTRNDERAGGAAAEVPAELEGEFEAVGRHPPLRALLVMRALSGALPVLLALCAVSGNMVNVHQGQAVLLQFGGSGSISALNDFSNDNTITGLRFTGVMATEGSQRGTLEFDVKLNKMNGRSTTSSDSGIWWATRWPSFGGGKEVARDIDASVLASTKNKVGDAEPKHRGFGRKVERLDATKDGPHKSQGVGDNGDEFSASAGFSLSSVKRFFDAIGSWLCKDILQGDFIFAEGWID